MVDTLNENHSQRMREWEYAEVEGVICVATQNIQQQIKVNEAAFSSNV